MLSILIPCYNFNAVPLVKELYKQAENLQIIFEIICIDDASKSTLNLHNNSINLLEHATFHEIENNIGRSAMRNLLASKAKYHNLLFLDVDVFPKDANFIKRYLTSKDSSVIYGGLECSIQKPETTNALRWKYTLKRECIPYKKRLLNPFLNFSSACFFIKKEIFNLIKFDETLKQYGWEDVLFAHHLQQHNTPITHIENPVLHNNIETSVVYLQKTNHAIKNLSSLLRNNKVPYSLYRISKLHAQINKLHITPFLNVVFNLTKKNIKRNLLSQNPNLLLFDFYKLGLLSSLTKN